VEAFFKAMGKGGKGFSLFKRKPRDQGQSATGGFTLDDLLLYSNVRISNCNAAGLPGHSAAATSPGPSQTPPAAHSLPF
jgi:hypothetical protein